MKVVDSCGWLAYLVRALSIKNVYHALTHLYTFSGGPVLSSKSYATKQRGLFLLFLLTILVAVLLLQTVLSTLLWQRTQTFVTIFLGIFIEATPFLVAGALVSGLIAEFVSPDLLRRLSPRHPLGGSVVGGLLGLAFPVCECGVVPVTRRLYGKGLPLSTGIAFLLSAPVINPVVIASTYAAFGWSTVFWWRMAGAFGIAVMVGLLFHRAMPDDVLRAETHLGTGHGACCAPDSDDGANNALALRLDQRLWRALTVSGDEFLEMTHYLVIGCLLAAAMQVIVPQSVLLAWGRGPVLSVLALMVLAFVLSVCSTVDAFIALAFVNTFSPGAVLAFLVFGPMVDIKSLLLFRQVFNRRTIIYLVVLPMLLTGIFAVAFNIVGG